MEPDPIAARPDMRARWRRIVALQRAVADLARQRRELLDKIGTRREVIRKLQIEYHTEYNLAKGEK